MEFDADVYDQRYSEDEYRAELGGYEYARWDALQHFISKVVRPEQVETVMDYGCGRGMFLPLLMELFPDSNFLCADISKTGIEKLQAEFAEHPVSTALIVDNRAEVPDESADVVVSVEVMEHVESVSAYLGDIYRVLKPGGVLIWTTPCANELSLEHIWGTLTSRIDPTDEGYRRWRWEEITHLRRLKTREARKLAMAEGFDPVFFRLRAHLFSSLMTSAMRRPRLKHLLQNHERSLLNLDYKLFRRLPNGASMIGCAKKPG